MDGTTHGPWAEGLIIGPWVALFAHGRSIVGPRAELLGVWAPQIGPWAELVGPLADFVGTNGKLYRATSSKEKKIMFIGHHGGYVFSRVHATL